MKVILVAGKHGRSRALSLGRWTRALLSLCVLGLPMGAGLAIGYVAGQQQSPVGDGALARLKQKIQSQQQELGEVRDQSERRLAAMTVRMAELQARLVRLDALGERMTGLAKLDEGEFDFSQPPAVGGPETADLGADLQQPDLFNAIDQLATRIDDREQQLEILETLLVDRKLADDIFVAGRPILKGWMSSRFGHRNDPFTGRVAMHEGVDFAGKDGSDIISVAAGVVTWSGERYGYGQMVEINHGGGYVTRYAHCKENLVKVGDVVKKGQVIALMGSSGRSTGPHVHFEVYKHGRAVDPATYIHRASR